MSTIPQVRRSSAFVRTSLHTRSFAAPALNLTWTERLRERYSDIVVNLMDSAEPERHLLLCTLYGVDGSWDL